MSTICIRFSGRFQCRLATDPDPYDEPRGVSGYVGALRGEPNLDRVLRWQPAGTVARPHCPSIGVSVDQIWLSGKAVPEHALLGAAVDLLDQPKFEGRNWIIARDGFEPIVPFHLRIASDCFILDRSHAATAGDPPFSSELLAQGLVFAPGEVRESSGVWDPAEAWKERIRLLDADLVSDPEPLRTANQTRIAMMSSELTKPANKSTLKFFPAKMPYFIKLSGPALVLDPEDKLEGTADTSAPWMVDVWLGAWDPNALSGFVRGYLTIPLLRNSDEIRAKVAVDGNSADRSMAEAGMSTLLTSERRIR